MFPSVPVYIDAAVLLRMFLRNVASRGCVSIDVVEWCLRTGPGSFEIRPGSTTRDVFVCTVGVGLVECNDPSVVILLVGGDAIGDVSMVFGLRVWQWAFAGTCARSAFP